jgi:hypothetical protein
MGKLGGYEHFLRLYTDSISAEARAEAVQVLLPLCNSTVKEQEVCLHLT